MITTKEILKNHTLSKQLSTVNSIRNTNSTVNSIAEKDKVGEVLNELTGKPQYCAEELAQRLGDSKSLRYYQILATEYGPSKLLEALAITLEADKQGIVRYKPAYFQGILKKWGFTTKFSKS